MQLPGSRSWICCLEVDVLPLLSWSQILVRMPRSRRRPKGEDVVRRAATVAILMRLECRS